MAFPLKTMLGLTVLGTLAFSFVEFPGRVEKTTDLNISSQASSSLDQNTWGTFHKINSQQGTAVTPSSEFDVTREENDIPPISPAAFEKINKWRTERGYNLGGVAGDINEYEGYSDETLKSLINNGDMRAMIALADRMLEKYENYPEYKTTEALDKRRMELYYKASLHGSTYAAIKLANVAEYGLHNPSPDQKRAQELESLAWKAFASKRGDRGSFFNGLHVLDAQDKGLTPMEEQAVLNRSNRIYDYLLEQRQALGLGDFDNSVSEEVKHLDEMSYPESKESPFLKR